MARIADLLTNAVLFLYPSEDDVGAGHPAGGTGFVVQWQSPDGEKVVFVVTANHVVAQGARTLGVRTDDGRVLAVPSEEAHWTQHPNGDDVAVAVLNKASGRSSVLDPLIWGDLAVTPERLEELNVGVGDNAFMLGRFVRSGGEATSQPLARFGNIAMVPGPKVTDARQLNVEAWLVEMHSLSGYSGSPVFVHIPPGSYRGDGRMMPLFSETTGLIGVDTGHLDLRRPVLSGMEATRIGDVELAVALNAGMAVVSPVWKVEETMQAAVEDGVTSIP